MTTLKAIQTEKAPAAIGPYSQAIVAPPFLYVSGQIGLDPASGEMVSIEFPVQAHRAIENMKAILEAAGCTLNDVVAVDVFLNDIIRFGEFNEIYTEYFTDHRPARAVVAVRGLPKDALIEIRCTACNQSLTA